MAVHFSDVPVSVVSATAKNESTNLKSNERFMVSNTYSNCIYKFLFCTFSLSLTKWSPSCNSWPRTYISVLILSLKRITNELS